MKIAVIGAGPAGAWTAYRLARLGARVTIFDASHPREKPCGGGVTGRALAIVRDALDPTALAATRIRRARFTAGSGDDAEVDLEAQALVVTSRAAFDTALVAAAQKAGATLNASRVADVEIVSDGVHVRTRESGAHVLHAADFVVGADGANGLVRRRVALPFRRDQLSVATGFYARGTTSTEIVIELTSDPAGYIWSFPRPDHLAVGICAQADGVSATQPLREQTRRWIVERGVAPGAPLEAYSWPIPSLRSGDWAAAPLAGSRWSLVGDAAGLVDPITREGIYFALASGGWAADALACGDARAADRYRERVRSEAMDELVRAARLKDLFFRPAFTNLLRRALRESASVRSVMADLIAGTQPYRTLKWRLLETLELGLGWRALRSIG